MTKWLLIIIGITFMLMSMRFEKDWQTSMILGVICFSSSIIINEINKLKQ